MFLKGEFSNRLVQLSLFSAIVYYITAYPVVFEKARKYFPIKFKKTHHLLIFHTFVFMVLMYLLTYFVFDPLVKVVEGKDEGSQSISELKNKAMTIITKLRKNAKPEVEENCQQQHEDLETEEYYKCIINTANVIAAEYI
tara:strand:+ start:1516 stop:1935 length:420 start_codon:yes stop_codon:yes gene_type:complete